MSLPLFAIKRPVTTAMILIGFAVFGAVSLFLIPVELLPNMDNPQVMIYVPYQSSSPAEIERDITIPLEESLSTLTGLKSIKSSSSESSSRITLEYNVDSDLRLAMVEIRDRVDRVRYRLPSDVRQVIIFRWSYGQIPVIFMAVTGQFSSDELSRKIIFVLKKRLERLDGVAQVDVYGILSKQIDIDLSLAALGAYNINIYQVFMSLRNNNMNLSSGYILDGGKKYFVRTIGEFESVGEVAGIPVAGSNIKLNDIANVKYEFPELNSYWRLDGKPAILISISKQSRTNVVEVADKIKAVLDNFENDKQLKGLKAYPIWDSSTMVTQSLNILKGNGLLGFILVVGVLFLFLKKYKSVLIISLAIPLSLTIACSIFYLLNRLTGMEFSFNIISLIGLILSVGMLVDSSIVVIESIFRHKEEGMKAREASIIGSSEVAMAVLAGTLTTAVVFLSKIFDSTSSFATIMRDFAVSIIVILFSSLFVSLTLVPMASSVLFRNLEPKKDRFKGFLTDKMGKILRSFLRFRWVVLLGTVLIFLTALKLYENLQVSIQFNTPARQMTIGMEFAKGLPLKDIGSVVAETEKILRDKKQELEIKAMVTRYTRRTGSLTIYLTDEKDSKRTTERIKRDMVKLLPVTPGVVFKTEGLYGAGGGASLSISLRINGPDQMVLEIIGKDLEKKLSDLYGKKNVSLNIEAGDDRMLVNLNRIRSQQYGLTPLLVGYNLLSAYGERPVTYFRSVDREVPIIIRLQKEDRTGLSSLKKLGMAGNQENVSLESIADFKVESGPSTYERENKEGAIQIQISADRQAIFLTLKGVSKMMDKYPLPAGYSWGFGEQWIEQFSSQESSNFAMYLAALMIYIIMVALFESFIHPFTIMTAIPFAFIGTFLIMFFTGTNIDYYVELGFLVLMGIVVNNAIVLIDQINRLRREGYSRTEAIVSANSHRMRPILMTALTTILALLPMAGPILMPGIFSSPEGMARMWAPMSLVIIGGLAMSTFLTLMVIPCIYTIVDDFSNSIKRVFIKSK
jgi:HAE1 family hydrophobic/amphiphilic exporter-1